MSLRSRWLFRPEDRVEGWLTRHHQERVLAGETKPVGPCPDESFLQSLARHSNQIAFTDPRVGHAANCPICMRRLLELRPAYRAGRRRMVLTVAAACCCMIIVALILVAGIAFAAGGLQEIVSPGKSGFLLHPGDVDALETHLRTLIEDAKLAHRMGVAGREWPLLAAGSWLSSIMTICGRRAVIARCGGCYATIRASRFVSRACACAFATNALTASIDFA